MASPSIGAMKSMSDIDAVSGVDVDLDFIPMRMRRQHVFVHNTGVAGPLAA
jgi:hypothetical protein